MLVHLKEPYGVMHLHGYRIYGRWTGRSAVDIPAQMYDRYRSLFVDGTYHAGDIAFRVKELPHLPYITVQTIASRIGAMRFQGQCTRKELEKLIRKKLKNESPTISTSSGT